MTDYLTVTMLAQALGVKRHAIHTLIRAGKLPCERLGSVLLIQRSVAREHYPHLDLGAKQ